MKNNQTTALNLERSRRTLPRKTILRGHNSFSDVLSKGQYFVHFPIKCTYLLGDEQQQDLKIGFSVSRNVRTAVQRNRLKRLMREAFRLHRHLLDQQGNDKRSLKVLFLFLQSNPEYIRQLKFAQVEQWMIAVLETLTKRL